MMTLILLPILLLVAMPLYTKVDRLQKRQAWLERRVDAGLAQLGVSAAAAPHAVAARRLVEEDRLGEAVRVWRDATGDPLAESRTQVERLAQDPGSASGSASGPAH